MSFTPNIPLSSQSLGVTQQPIQDNFNVINTTLSVNHIAMNSSGAGKHKFVQMPQQGSAPSTSATEVAIYTKSVSGATQWFYRPRSNGTEVQLSVDLPAAVNNANGAGSKTFFSFLPGGKLMIYGYSTNSQNGSTITLSTTLSTMDNVQLTALGNSPQGTNRAFVAQPRTVNTAGTASMVINLQDVNNSAVGSDRSVYFMVIGSP